MTHKRLVIAVVMTISGILLASIAFFGTQIPMQIRLALAVVGALDMLAAIIFYGMVFRAK